MIKKPIGIFSPMDALTSPELSISPPYSYIRPGTIFGG